MTIGTCLVAFYIPVGPGSINPLWLRTDIGYTQIVRVEADL